MATRKQRPIQATLPFRQRGGARKGAGRKPKGERAGVPHRIRAIHAARQPAHVTVKLRQSLPRLRRGPEYAALRAAFASGSDRFGCRLIQFAVLNDHLHLLVEAEDRNSLRRGIQGLLIRIARALNKLWARRGKVFADRYHDRALRSPKEVRRALVYVLANGRKHAAAGRAVNVPQPIDVFTSAPWFDGFRETFTVRGLSAVVRPVADARTWLLRVGWRRLGLLSVHELPATA